MAKSSVRIVRRRSPVKRVPPDQIPVRSRQGVDHMPVVPPPSPGEDDEEAMNAAADWWFIQQHGEDELKRRKELLKQYEGRWTKTTK